MSDCIFCKIVHDESAARVVYRDEQVTAFRDIHPVAPTHILIVPNKHIGSVSELTSGDEALAGHLLTVAGQLASQKASPNPVIVSSPTRGRTADRPSSICMST